MKLPAWVREVNWFVVVGITATACHAGVTLAVNRLFGLGPMTASVVGYASSVSISYLGNAWLTFRRPVMHGPQVLRFAVISLAGFALNQAIVFVCTHMLGWPLKWALIPVVLLVPTSTFVMAKLWAFRSPSPVPAPPPPRLRRGPPPPLRG